MNQWLNNTLERIEKASNSFLGYPLAKDFTYDHFAPFLNVCINNVGDPETTSTPFLNHLMSVVPPYPVCSDAVRVRSNKLNSEKEHLVL